MNHAKEKGDKVFKIWGSGKPLREFLYVDDLSSCIDFILKNNIEVDLINIGSGEEISILDLAEKIKKVIGYHGELSF